MACAVPLLFLGHVSSEREIKSAMTDCSDKLRPGDPVSNRYRHLQLTLKKCQTRSVKPTLCWGKC